MSGYIPMDTFLPMSPARLTPSNKPVPISYIRHLQSRLGPVGFPVGNFEASSVVPDALPSSPPGQKER